VKFNLFGTLKKVALLVILMVCLDTFDLFSTGVVFFIKIEITPVFFSLLHFQLLHQEIHLVKRLLVLD
jgi:hypothetical protein